MTSEADPTTSDPTVAEVEVPSIRTIAIVLLVAGLIGSAASMALSVEKYWLLTNPLYTPSCNLGETINCGAIMNSAQAAAFGFPNPYLGLIGFAVVAATGAVTLAGGRMRTWYWVGLFIGSILGTVFVVWMIIQSLVVLDALCPYCMVVWAATMTTLWYTALQLAWLADSRLPDRIFRVLQGAGHHHSAVLVGVLALIAVAVAVAAAQ